MESNDTFEQSDAQPGIVLTFEAQSYLRQAGKWAGFLGILGFIMCGLLLLMALFVGTMFSMLAQFSPVYSSIPAGVGGILSFVIILVDVLYFFFALYLYQFSDRVKKGIIFTDPDYVTQALSKLKSFFKLWAIVTIIVLSLYALEIIGVVLIGLSRH